MSQHFPSPGKAGLGRVCFSYAVVLCDLVVPCIRTAFAAGLPGAGV